MSSGTISCCYCFSANSDSEEENEEEEALIEEVNREQVENRPIIVNQKERNRRIAGVKKKYNLKSSDNLKSSSHNTISSENVSLKICIYKNNSSDEFKIYILEAINVLPVLHSKYPNIVLIPLKSELSIIQVHTKLFPTHSRGKSRVQEISESITGSVKFSRECLHEMTASQYQSKLNGIRFRLYFKQDNSLQTTKRKILLGEYSLDFENLQLQTTLTNIVIHLHDHSEIDSKPPEVYPIYSEIDRSDKNDLKESGNERTQQLESLQDKTQTLKNQAENFYKTSVEIRQKKEKKRKRKMINK